MVLQDCCGIILGLSWDHSAAFFCILLFGMIQNDSQMASYWVGSLFVSTRCPKTKGLTIWHQRIIEIMIEFYNTTATKWSRKTSFGKKWSSNTRMAEIGLKPNWRREGKQKGESVGHLPTPEASSKKSKQSHLFKDCIATTKNSQGFLCCATWRHLPPSLGSSLQYVGYGTWGCQREW